MESLTPLEAASYTLAGFRTDSAMPAHTRSQVLENRGPLTAAPGRQLPLRVAGPFSFCAGHNVDFAPECFHFS
jgi:hypothetical protein